MKKVILVVVLGLLAAMPFASQMLLENSSPVADSNWSDAGHDLSSEVTESLSAILAPVHEQVPILSVRPSAMSGVYEVILSNEQVLYVNAAGSHFVVGDLFGLEEDYLVNLSTEAKDIARSAFNEVRKEAVTGMGVETLMIYPASIETAAVVTIFTDIDCAYCRKLHAEMADYGALGIEIRYAAYPRAGRGSQAYDDIITAWCSDDPNGAMDLFMRLKSVPPLTCDHPVDDHLDVGDAIGVTGTPAIVAEDGTLLPGYLSPNDLAYQLGIL